MLRITNLVERWRRDSFFKTELSYLDNLRKELRIKEKSQQNIHKVEEIY